MPIPGTHLALTGAGTDHTNYTSIRKLMCKRHIPEHFSISACQHFSYRVRRPWLTG
jgi:hypothetical protein